MYKKKQFVLSMLVIMVLVSSIFLTGCDNNPPQTSLSSTYEVSGVVEDENEGGISNVKVKYDNGQTSTSEKGSWEIVGLTKPVTLEFAKEGYTFTPSEYNVDKEETGIEITANEDSGTVNITTEGSGSVDKNELSTASGNEVELTALPDDGWKFAQWEGDISGTDNPKTITVEEDINVTAVFAEKDYPLNINIDGKGTVNEKDVSSTSDGKKVELTAQPSTGWKFDQWNGDLSGSENPTTIIVDQEKNVTAEFVRKVYSLNISTEGSGTVSKDPSEAEYDYGTEVELTADPDSNWSFSNWEGDLSGTENPKTITIDSDKSVTAVFSSDSTNDFTLNVGSGGNVIVEEPDGNTVTVDADSTYNYTSEQTETLTLTAEPLNKKYVFDSWSGDSTDSSNSIEITLDQDKALDAKFAGNVFKLVNSWGSTWGPNNDGTLYITYDAAIKVGLDAWVLGKRDNYQAEALALFDVEGSNRGDWTFAIKIPSRSSNNKKYFYPQNQVQKGGDEPFPGNKIAMDITELMPFESEDIVFEITNNSNSSGTLEYFGIEINGDQYNSKISNLSIASGSSKEVTLDNVSSETATVSSLSSQNKLESAARAINSSDIENYLKKVNVNNIGNEIINGQGTGWKNMTRKQWQKAKEEGSIKILESQDVLSTFNVKSQGDSEINIVDHSQSKHFPPIGDQGAEGSCVAWSIGYYIKSFQGASDRGWDLSTGDDSKIMSPEFVYHLINGGVDYGSYYTDATRMIENIGVSSLEAMPYSDSDHTSWPSEAAFREAADYRSGLYQGATGYRMSIQDSEDIEAIQTIISNGYLVTVAIDAYQYDDLTENGVWTTDNYNSPNLNHANTIVGYYE